MQFSNILEMLKLVFSLVSVPLLATFLLGMFWRRTTGHGAFFGLVGGTAGALIFQGLSLKEGAVGSFVKGGWLFHVGTTHAVILFAWASFACLFGAALTHTARGEGATNADLQVRLGKFFLKILSPALAFFSLVIFCRPVMPFEFKSEMGQNFWIAIVAWTTCFVLTVLISLATKQTKTNEQLTGLVYSLTPKIKSENEPWYKRPVTVGVIILAVAIVLNIIFW